MSYNSFNAVNIGSNTSITLGGGGYGYTVQVMDGSGIVSSVQQAVQNNTATKRIGPKLYFNYVKSKLSKLETKKLKSRLSKLQKLIKSAEETGQTALYEELSKMLVVAVRESEAVACGYGTYVEMEHINKFRYLVKEDGDNVNPVNFSTLQEFPRAIPSNIKKIIKSVQKKGVFDELHVLYLDYTKEKIKSNKQKIREKDPVLFGTFSFDPNKLYFIADWVDEYCDLTLSKFIDTLKSDDAEYDVQAVEEVSVEYLERIKREIQERQDRLKETNPSNFRDKMVEEDKAELNRLREENEQLKQDNQVLAEDQDIDLAYERNAIAPEYWREEARKELEEIAKEKEAELAARPWYKKFFKKL